MENGIRTPIVLLKLMNTVFVAGEGKNVIWYK
jgi:hypothetical protein